MRKDLRIEYLVWTDSSGGTTLLSSGRESEKKNSTLFYTISKSEWALSSAAWSTRRALTSTSATGSLSSRKV